MIRDYTPEDTDALVDVWRAATALAHPFLSEAFVEQEAKNLRTLYLVNAQTRVLELDGEVVGFVAMIGTEIGGLFLAPEWHGRGYGRRLVDDIRRLGDIEVEVFARNSVGRRFYERYGFRPCGQTVHEATGEQVLRLWIGAVQEEAAP